MSDQLLPTKITECVEFIIPEFDTRPEVKLGFTKIQTGLKRLVEAKVVNPGTYAELEYTFNEGYREAKAHLSVVGFEIAKTKKIQRRLRSEYLLDEYPAFIKERRLNDNTANREAFLETHDDYVQAQDRLDLLVAIEHMLEGRIKVFENVCRYMKKEIDIVLKSGIDPNKYLR